MKRYPPFLSTIVFLLSWLGHLSFGAAAEFHAVVRAPDSGWEMTALTYRLGKLYRMSDDGRVIVGGGWSPNGGFVEAFR